MPESSRRTDASLSSALALARRALEARPSGLLTDFDGTLSPIVGDPSLARPSEGAAAALSALAAKLEVVAIVTGREPVDARRVVGVDTLLVAGNHGIEWLEPGTDAAVDTPDAAAVRARLRELLAHVPRQDGTVVEDKGISATVHYRNAADPPAARRAILEVLSDPSPLDLREGRMSVELRPVGLGDKGTAVRSIVERHALRGVVVMGDDLTDLDMFTAVAELRASGRIAAAIIAVGGEDHEMPPEVAAAADAILPAPPDVAAMLTALTRD